MTQQDLTQIDELIRDRLKNVATKDDVQSIVRRELKNYATKDDLRNFPTKDDLRKELAKYATKDDLRAELQAVRKDLEKTMGNLGEKIMDFISETIASKKDFRDLERRVDKIEDHLELS